MSGSRRLSYKQLKDEKAFMSHHTCWDFSPPSILYCQLLALAALRGDTTPDELWSSTCALKHAGVLAVLEMAANRGVWSTSWRRLTSPWCVLELTPLSTHQTRLFSLELEIPGYLFASPASSKQDAETQLSTLQNPEEGTENETNYRQKGGKKSQTKYFRNCSFSIRRQKRKMSKKGFANLKVLLHR